MSKRITLAQRAEFGLPVVAIGANAEPQKPLAASKPRKARTAKPKPPTEHEEQVLLFQWKQEYERKDARLGLLFAIPNGAKLPYGKNRKGQRFSKEALRLLAEGMQPGVPDICMAYPCNGAAGLYVELKRAQKSLSRVSDEQWKWIDRLRHFGYRAEICYGWEAARDVILNYLEGK